MDEEKKSVVPTGQDSPFEKIRHINNAGNEYWSSREFAEVLGYTDYRNFEQVIQKARTACFNSGQRIEDHFVDVTEMVDIGSGAQRPVPTVYLSRYACYLIIQNADPRKEIVALGQTYFATQTRRQELAEMKNDEERRLFLREEMRRIISYPSMPPRRVILFLPKIQEKRRRRWRRDSFYQCIPLFQVPR
jgi:DNA-damage-inducible protein D